MASVGALSILVSILLYFCGILLRIYGFLKRVLCCQCLSRENANSVNLVTSTGKLRIVKLEGGGGDDRPFLIRKFSREEEDKEDPGRLAEFSD